MELMYIHREACSPHSDIMGGVGMIMPYTLYTLRRRDIIYRRQIFMLKIFRAINFRIE